MRAQLDVEYPGQVSQSRLAHAICRQAAGRLDPWPGRYVHDRARTLLLHVPRRRLAQPQRRCQVDVEHEPQLLGRGAERVSLAGNEPMVFTSTSGGPTSAAIR